MSVENPQWFFNASQDPFSSKCPPVWTKYSSEDNKKIEQAFKAGAATAELSTHVIHIAENIQVHRVDFNRQRPVKREPKK